MIKVTHFLAVFGVLVGCSNPPTVAYWRFESGTAGKLVSPDVIIPDLSGNQNHLTVFNQTNAPLLSNIVPFDTVPQTGEPNRVSIDNTAIPPRNLPTRDLFLVHTGEGFDLGKDDLPEWTIEASIQLKPVKDGEKRWQTFVVRDGYNLPNHDALNEDRLANLAFKKRGDNNHLSIEAWDSTGKLVVVQSVDAVTVDEWYHVAAMSDGKKLSLYVKRSSDVAYVKQGEADFQGALLNGGGGWAVGRGCYANWPTEQFFGLIDEVRITATSLKPEQLLASAARMPVKPAPTPLVSKAIADKSSDVSYPLPSQDLIHPHDPATILADGKYHVFSTNEGIQHWRSSDLLHWEKLERVFAKTPDWAVKMIGERAGLWAPDVAYFNGRYHLYYSVSKFGSQRSAIGLATNVTLDPDAPNYQWDDHGPIIESKPGDDFNAIDPSIVLDNDNVPWMAWGSFNRGIYLAKLDASTGKLAEPDKSFHHLAARPRNDAIEGPQVFRHNGWYFLTISNDFCCRGEKSTYKLMVGRSRKITGPYLDRENQPMLDGHASLLLRGYDYIRGPGHSSVVLFGNQLMLTHHYYDARANGAPTLGVRPLYFDADGWPVVGEALESRGTTPADLSGTWTQYEDYANSSDLHLNADGTAADGKSVGTWELRGTTLILRWVLQIKEKQIVETDCFLSRDRMSFVGRMPDGTILTGVRKTAMNGS